MQHPFKMTAHLDWASARKRDLASPDTDRAASSSALSCDPRATPKHHHGLAPAMLSGVAENPLQRLWGMAPQGTPAHLHEWCEEEKAIRRTAQGCPGPGLNRTTPNSPPVGLLDFSKKKHTPKEATSYDCRGPCKR